MRRISWVFTAALAAVRSPVEMILFLYSTGLLFIALYMCSPLYDSGSPPLSVSIPQREIEYVIAGIFAIASAPGLLAPFVIRPKRDRLLKRAGATAFLCYLFLAIIRILVYGIIPIVWLPMLIISLGAGGLRLYLKVRRD